MTENEAIKTIRGAWSLMCQTNIRFASSMIIEKLRKLQ